MIRARLFELRQRDAVFTRGVGIRTLDRDQDARRKSHLKLVSPTTENRTVVATRQPNATYRTREYLTDAEVGRLMKAAANNRWGHRDATMILVAYRHGLRVSELVDLRWDQIDFNAGTLAVRRAKQGSPATHPIRGDELRALRRLQREQDPKSPFVFTSERGAPFTTAGFARLVERAGEAAKLGFKAPPSPHATARLRLRLGQQGPRHEESAGLSRAQEHPAHRALYRAGAGSVQGLLAVGADARRRSQT
jgi:integrase